MILWVTSFNRAIYEASGKRLLESFAQYQGEKAPIFVCHEDMPEIEETHWATDLAHDPWLRDWVYRNREAIPKSLGGEGREIEPGSPTVERMRKGTRESWFNRNAARWARKVASWRQASVASGSFDSIVWLDADCVFKRHVPDQLIEDAFKGSACFYMQGPSRKKSSFENGVVGFRGRYGMEILDRVFEVYESSTFQNLHRWDDCYILEKVIRSRPDIPTVDIAGQAVSEHLDVLASSLLGHHIRHDKGRHGRVLGLFK